MATEPPAGSRALVTGGARGIGAAIAQRLRDDGFEVTTADRDEGADLRFDVADTIDVGGSGSVRQGAGGDALAYAIGPNIGLAPFSNGWVSIGYNLVGFEDRDFERARYTRGGPHVTMRLKFDQDVLGLARR